MHTVWCICMQNWTTTTTTKKNKLKSEKKREEICVWCLVLIYLLDGRCYACMRYPYWMHHIRIRMCTIIRSLECGFHLCFIRIQNKVEKQILEGKRMGYILHRRTGIMRRIEMSWKWRKNKNTKKPIGTLKFTIGF